MNAATRRPRPAAIEWLLLLVGVALTIQYAWILDDAYVYFRYADHFVRGFGWVYNEGEYVEGYTSPLWLLALTAVRLVGVDYWLAIRAIGVAAFVAFWWGLVWLDRDLRPNARDAGAVPVVNLPLLFLAPNYATLCYFTSGVEAPLANLAAVAYALWIVRPERRIAGLAVALSPLARPELALALALAVAVVAWRTRRFPWRVAGTSAAAIGAWLVFRVFYYADLLPNTFYLKHESLWAQGFAYLHQSLSAYGVYPLAALVALAVVALRRRGVALDGAARIAMLAIAIAVATYIVRVGGDPRHHRYLAFPFCLAACSTAGLAAHVLAAFAPRLGRGWVFASAVAAAAIFGAAYPPQLSAHPLSRDVDHFPVALVNDAEYHRKKPGLSPPPWSLAPLGTGLDPALERTPADWRSGYETFDSSLWCYEHYWQLHHGVTHGAGLTDAFLARTIAKSGRPAHKPKLFGRAERISELRERYGAGPGAFRRAVEDGVAPAWVARNLDSIERIERKIYNRHDFAENLKLALTPVRPID